MTAVATEHHVPSESAVRIETLAVMTCERPRALLECVRSFVENARHGGRRCAVMVFDDTRDPRTRAIQRGALRRLARRLDTKIGYAGFEEKRAYRDALERETGAPRHVLDAALFGVASIRPSVGANRNAALLHFAGEAFAMTDDDTRARLAALQKRVDAALAERAKALREAIFQHFSQKAMVEGVLAGYRDAFVNH